MKMKLKTQVLFSFAVQFTLLAGAVAQSNSIADFMGSEEADRYDTYQPACSCPLANPSASECGWPQGVCASRNCFERKLAGGADCGPHFTGTYCGCEITCQMINADGSTTAATSVFTGSLITPEADCIGSSEPVGDGKMVCTAVKFKRKIATDPDASGFKTYSCQ